MRGEVVCLIGSTRFESAFRKLEVKLSLEGEIVLSPLVYNQHGDNPGCGLENKSNLDDLQKMKIDMCDKVLVVDANNPKEDGYVGKSTMDQIIYAQRLGKVVKYLSKENIEL